MMKEIIDLIGRHETFTLVTHFNPDGDAAGCLASLATFLRDQGKKVHAYYPGHLISTYDFLSARGGIMCYEDAEDADSRIAESPVIILLDANEWSRTEKIEQAIRRSPGLKVVIDHHPIEESEFDFTWVDVSAASAGELIYQLIKAMGGRITEEIGTALYVTILTDTGSFRYANTTARTHLIAAELIEAGVKTSLLYQEVYERNPVEKIRLLGYCLENLQIGCDNRMAWVSVSQDALKRYNAEIWMTDGVVEVVRTITRVEVTILIVEKGRDLVKLSLRSRNNLDVNVLARSLGGGGHPRAAGCVLKMDLKSAEQLITGKAREALAGCL